MNNADTITDIFKMLFLVFSRFIVDFIINIIIYNSAINPTIPNSQKTSNIYECASFA